MWARLNCWNTWVGTSQLFRKRLCLYSREIWPRSVVSGGLMKIILAASVDCPGLKMAPMI